MSAVDDNLSGPIEIQSLRWEVDRLNKIIGALLDRSERMTEVPRSEYGRFQRRLVLGEVVRQRTEELHSALSENESITRKLRVSEARFRGLAEQSLVGIAVVEAGGFLFANPLFAEVFGYSQTELKALPLLATVSDEDAELFGEHLSKCLADEPHESLLSYKGRKKDGTIIELELSVSRMRTSERDESLTFVVKDVTASKQAEREVRALTDRLAELAVRDPLTGLYNRRFMEASLEREVVAATRNDAPLSVVICDIDHFKAVNDTYGHQAGDEVLQAFASMLKQQCRKSDIACRYGGEEFLVVFPGMQMSMAAEWAERARAAVAEAEIETGGGTLRITASFGVAGYPANGESWHEVVAASDAALYSAKTGGRDQVRRAPFPLSVCDTGPQQTPTGQSQKTSADPPAQYGTRT